MSETTKNASGYSIPAYIVHMVIGSLIVMTVGSSGAAIYTAMELSQGLDKLNKLPSPGLMKERRSEYEQFKAQVNRRLDRIENKIYGTNWDGSLIPKTKVVPAGYWFKHRPTPKPTPKPTPTPNPQFATLQWSKRQ